VFAPQEGKNVEVVVVKFGLIFQFSNGGTEENHETPESRQPIFKMRIEREIPVYVS
jgi:hypothetical protein